MHYCSIYIFYFGPLYLLSILHPLLPAFLLHSIFNLEISKKTAPPVTILNTVDEILIIASKSFYSVVIIAVIVVVRITVHNDVGKYIYNGVLMSLITPYYLIYQST